MMMKEEAIKLHEARYWAEEARRCARISRWLGWLAIALAVTGVALSAWSIFLKHRAVGKDGVGRAAPVEIERTGEVGASTSRDVADGDVIASALRQCGVLTAP